MVDSHRGIRWAAEVAVSEVLPQSHLVGFGEAIGARVPELFRQCLPEASAVQLTSVGKAFRRIYDTEGWSRSNLFPGVREALQSLTASGVTCHVVTNKPSGPTGDMLALHGLRELLGEVVSPDSAPGHGSKEAALASLVRGLRLSADSVLYVGDTVEDHDAAAAVGTAFIGAGYGYGREGLLALPQVVVCSDPQGLLACVTAKSSAG